MKPKILFFNVLFSLAGSLLVLFVVLPLVSTILSTTPAAFLNSFGDPEVLHSIGLTFGAAAIATALALTTGVPLAYLLARHRFRRSSTYRWSFPTPRPVWLCCWFSGGAD